MRLDLIVGPNGAGKTTIAELPLVRIAISLSDSASVWDNSAPDRQPRRVARFVRGDAVEGSAVATVGAE